jgi:hypothetical protein
VPVFTGLFSGSTQSFILDFAGIRFPRRQAMSCCDETTARVPSFDLSRRSMLKGTVVVASVMSAVRPTASDAQAKRVKLAY